MLPRSNPAGIDRVVKPHQPCRERQLPPDQTALTGLREARFGIPESGVAANYGIGILTIQSRSSAPATRRSNLAATPLGEAPAFGSLLLPPTLYLVYMGQLGRV